MIPVPRKATTVILARENPGGFEVFLLKRHEKSTFMAGNYVYPGGGVDPEDCRLETYARCRGTSPEEAHRILGGSATPEESLGYWVAGIRELFEEGGVLLAYDGKGSLFLPRNPAHREKVMGFRHSLQEGRLTISQMARDEDLFLAVDHLSYYAHWMTPEAYPQRFDTRFFLARHPRGQEASHDQREMTSGTWVTPRGALEKNAKGEMILSPPTLKTVEDLSFFSHLDDLFSPLQRELIQPVLPVFKKTLNQTFIVYPWDPDYETFLRGEIPAPLDHGKPSGPGDRSTRILFSEGRWHLYHRSR